MKAFLVALAVAVVISAITVGLIATLVMLFASATAGEPDVFAATRDQWEARGRSVKGS